MPRPYRFFVALLNIALFAALGMQAHRLYSSPKLVGEPYETFSCLMLERRAMSEAEHDQNWQWCCYECRVRGLHSLFALANAGAFLGVAEALPTASRLGFHNQVRVFYGAMPLAIIAWWYLIGDGITFVRYRWQSSARSVEPR